MFHARCNHPKEIRIVVKTLRNDGAPVIVSRAYGIVSYGRRRVKTKGNSTARRARGDGYVRRGAEPAAPTVRWTAAV